MTKQKMKQKMKIMSRLALALVVLLTGTLVTATQPRPAQAVGRNELQRALLGTVRVAVARIAKRARVITRDSLRTAVVSELNDKFSLVASDEQCKAAVEWCIDTGLIRRSDERPDAFDFVSSL